MILMMSPDTDEPSASGKVSARAASSSPPQPEAENCSKDFAHGKSLTKAGPARKQIQRVKDRPADRLEGYKAALHAHQLPFEPSLVEASENTFDGGYTACKLLLQQNPRLTAVFASNDEAAYGVLYVLQEMNILVPQQISVCGFEDLVQSKKIWPGLTTIHQPADDMIAQATHMLIRILKDDPLQEQQILLPSLLVLRGSTSPVRSRKSIHPFGLNAVLFPLPGRDSINMPLSSVRL